MSSTDWTVTEALAPRRVVPVKFVVSGAVVLLAIGYLVLTGLSTATVYYVTVSEFQAQGAADGRPVRVSGEVVPGSIVRAGATVRFAVADGGGRLPVVYTGVVPDIFGENIQVVVEGRAGADGAFQATSVLAKCPSKFEAAAPAGGSA